MTSDVYDTDPGWICDEYRLPDRFVYLPNQFWVHKGHRLVIEALAELPANQPDVTVVCTGNTCWHTTEKYDYPPDARVTIHEDTWKPGPSVTFREHTGRGYWAGETWKEW